MGPGAQSRRQGQAAARRAGGELVRPQRRNVIRLAAGCYNIRDAEGHQGRYVCPDCPDERFILPFQPFGLKLHVREHEEAAGPCGVGCAGPALRGS